MKKLFTLIAMTMLVVASQAQSLQFCYADGTVIPDGTEIVATTVNEELLEWDEIQLESGVFVKNTSAGNVTATLSFNITELSEESSLSVCLGTNCHMYTETGENSISNVKLNGNSINDLMCHWVPAVNDDYEYLPGNCKAIYTISEGGNKCSTITINFVYGDTSVNGINTSDAKIVATYTANGQLASASQKGLLIQKMSDGSIRKVIK